MGASESTADQLPEEMERLRERVSRLERELAESMRREAALRAALADSARQVEKLRMAEQRLEQFLQHSRDVVYRLDLTTGRYEYFSSTTEEYSGFSREEMVAMGFEGVQARMHPDDRPRFLEYVNRQISADGTGGQPLAIEYRWRCRDGSYRWFSDSGRLIRDDKGNPRAAVGTVRDIHERKLAEQKLAEREATLEAIIDASPLPVVALDVEGNVVLWNPAAERMFGWHPDEVLGRFNPFIPPGEVEAFWSRYRQVMKSGGRTTIEGRFLTKDGSVIEVRLSAAPLLDGDGNTAGAVGLIDDITELLKSERALRESEERYRGLVEDMPALICRAKGDGTLVYVNDAYCECFGREREDLIGRSFFDLIPEEHHPEVWERFGSLTAENPVVSYEHAVVAPDGSIGYQRWSDRVLCDAGGVPIEYQSVGIDITERRRAEEALRQSEELIRRVLDTDPNCIFLKDADGRYVLVNRATAAAFGTTPEQMIGKTDYDFVSDHGFRREEADEFAMHDRTTFRSGRQHVTPEEKLTLPDGSTRWFQSTRVPLEGASGRAMLLGVAVDITERKKVGEALRASEKQYRELVENANSCIVRMDREGNITFFNRFGQEFFGYSEDEIIGRNVVGTIVPETESSGRDLRAFIENLLRNPDKYVSNENENMRRNGERVWFDWTNRGIRDESGDVVEILSVGHDITERRQAEDALGKSQETFRLLVENAFDGVNICEFDPVAMKRRLLFCNDRYVEMSGYTLEELEGADNLNDLVTQHHSKAEREHDYHCILNGIPFRGTCSWKRPDGKPNTYEWSAVAVPSGDKYHIIGIDRDVTERREAEIRLRESREQLRALAARLQSVREAERTTIAREIHDELGHALAPLKLDLSLLRRRAASHYDEGFVELLQQKLDAMTGVVDRAIRAVRRICTELRPSVLDDLGLTAAIEWQVQEFESRTGIRCAFARELEDFSLDRDRATALFRICQELLTNVARHAQATAVTLDLQRKDSSIVLRVRDNGRGIAPEQVSSSRSLGILGMRERVLAFGGSVEIAGADGKGTQADVIIPIA